jgi:hypothetical protein
MVAENFAQTLAESEDKRTLVEAELAQCQVQRDHAGQLVAEIKEAMQVRSSQRVSAISGI